MRFHFVGNLDCPDWILAEIAAFSRLSSIKFKLWCSGAVTQFLKNEDWPKERLDKLNADGTFDTNGLKGFLAAIEFVLESGAKNDCSSQDLNAEMQQLGLPAEHAQQLCKVYEANKVQLVEVLKQRSFKYGSCELTGHSIATFTLPNATEQKYAVLEFMTADSTTPLQLALTTEKLTVLRSELTEALRLAKQCET